MKWFFAAFRQYANFSGRASRTEFWMFTLFNTILVLLLAAIVIALRRFFPHILDSDYRFIFVVIAAYLSVTIIPTIAISIRRLHDIEHGSVYLLYTLFPIVGWLILLALFCTPSDDYENKYGKQPLSTAHIVSKNTFLRKALIWLIISSLFYTSIQILSTDAVLSKLSIIAILLIPRYTIMGISFLQEKNYSRFVGVLFLVSCLYNSIATIFYSYIYPSNFPPFISLIKYLSMILMIFFSIQLIRKRRYAPLTDYALLSSGILAIFSELFGGIMFWKSFGIRLTADYLYQQYIPIFSSILLSASLVSYAIANRKEQKERRLDGENAKLDVLSQTSN